MKNVFLSFTGPEFEAGPGHLSAPGHTDDRPYLFILCSVIVHILVMLVFTSIDSGSIKLFKIPIDPLEIEIVDLPENIKGALKVPDKVTALAQRSQEVLKEEYPKRPDRVSPRPAMPVAAPSSPGAIVLVKPGGKERGEEAGEKTSIQNESQDRAITKKPEDEMSTALSEIPVVLKPSSRTKGSEVDGSGEGKGSLSLIPTEGSLQQIAREEKTAVDSPREGGGMTLLLNTAEFKYQNYFMNVKRRIEFYWEYPPLAARNGQQGRLNIDFVIHKDGTIEVGDIEIIKSSNYPILDDAATTALRLASPFNPFPEGFDVEEITVHGSFEYSLIRTKR